MPSPSSKKVRAVLMLFAIVGTALLGLAGGGWGGPALAQTVPTMTPSPAPTSTPANHDQGPSEAPAAAPTDQAPTETPAAPETEVFRAGLPQSVDVGVGIVTLLSRQGGVGPRKQLADIGSSKAEVVSALPSAPSGWKQVTAGIRLMAVATNGAPITYFSQGAFICFRVPAGAPSGVRTAYFDGTPRVNRWVFLGTALTPGGLACTPRFYFPGTFALFGRS